jgi:radical SAM protein with 4Fe4S-binding SPASM domain
MSGTFAKLCEGWYLRGWSDLPYAVSRWGYEETRALTPAGFYVLDSCDGKTDFNALAFLPVHLAMLSKLIEEGVAERCAEGDGIPPYQSYRKSDNPRLVGIDWCVTGRCNLKCRHCFMESPDGKYGQPSFDACARLIDQFERANVQRVALTGGEPFMRKDVLRIVKRLAEKKIWLDQIYSNGLLIAERHLEEIRATGMLPCLQISFDGVGCHDRMRGVAGVEAQTREAIRRIVSAGFPVVVATSIDRESVAALPGTYATMRELGVVSWRVSLPEPTGNWRRHGRDPTLEQVAAACLPLLELWLRDGKPFYLQLAGFFKGAPERCDGSVRPLPRIAYALDDYDCRACRDTAYLLPNGTLLPCAGYVDTGVEPRMPNLLTDMDLSAAWQSAAVRRFANLRVKDVLAGNPECAVCPHLHECGLGCRASALSRTGDALRRDPYACALWRSGYRQRFASLAGLAA